jgi:hypothetical protein
LRELDLAPIINLVVFYDVTIRSWRRVKRAYELSIVVGSLKEFRSRNFSVLGRVGLELIIRREGGNLRGVQINVLSLHFRSILRFVVSWPSVFIRTVSSYVMWKIRRVGFSLFF